MTHRVTLSLAARFELESAAAWYREQSGSAEVAEKWHRGFMTAIRSLRQNPDRCGMIAESDQFPYELRELLYGSGRRRTHRAIFRIMGNTVQVVTIRHVAQRDLTPDDL